MARWVRILSPLFVTSLVTFVGSALGLVLLRATVLACTVGFSTSTLPLSAAQAALCPVYDVGSGFLVAIALVACGLVTWLGARTFMHRGSESAASVRISGGREGGSSLARSGPLRSLLQLPAYQWVCLLVAFFFTATFFAESWAYLHLATVSADLAINQQLLSSTFLGGKPYLFYSAYICVHFGECSYLQEHQAFIAFGVALVYGVAPTPFTLFAIQSLVLGLGALPLYALAVDVIGSRRLSLVVAAAYLSWLPLLMPAIRDTFHWEAFIPVEMLTLFLLWNRHRYRLAIPIVLLAFVTYEVNTVLAFFVGLYFLWPWLLRAVRLFIRAILTSFAAPAGSPSKLRLWTRWIWKTVHVPEVYASLLLMSISVVGYLLLRLFGLDAGTLFGVPTVSPASPLQGSFLNRDFGFSFAAISFMWTTKLWFWLMIYLTLGFIPLLAPRTLILALPWIAFTVFNTTTAFFTFFGIYDFVPAAAVLIGFTFGLRQLHLWTNVDSTTPVAGPRDAVEDSASTAADARGVYAFHEGRWTLDRFPRHESSKAVATLAVGVVIIIGGNLFLSPLNPIGDSVRSNLGAPFYTPLYVFSYASSPSDQPLQQLLSLIPKNTVVAAATPSGFSLVADDPYAYPLAGPKYPVSALPDNESSRTEFVLLPYDAPNVDLAGSGLLESLYDRADFGVRGCVTDSAIGGVELFQRNYSGPPEAFGAVNPLCTDSFSAGAGLMPGPNASILVDSSSPSGVVVSSAPCPANDLVSAGPGIVLPPGEYGVDVVLDALNTTNSSCQGSVRPAQPLVRLNVTGQNVTGVQRFYAHQLTERQLCDPTCGGWYYLNTSINLFAAASDLSVNSFVLIGQYILQISYVLLIPEQPQS